jgi:transcriptional repressor NrdR
VWPDKSFKFPIDTLHIEAKIGRKGYVVALETHQNSKDACVRCPFCKEDNDKVIDSRSSEGGRIIRRRRECIECGRRFTTYEKIGESFKLNVVKKDGTRVPYDRDKLIAGLQKACYKRLVSAEKIQEVADRIEEEIFRSYDKEVSALFVGEQAMRFLRKVDKVAYIRFASVYRDFTDAGDLLDEVSQAIAESDTTDQPNLF